MRCFRNVLQGQSPGAITYHAEPRKMMDEWVDSVYTEYDDCRLLVVGVELLQVGSGQLGEKYEVQ